MTPPAWRRSLLPLLCVGCLFTFLLSPWASAAEDDEKDEKGLKGRFLPKADPTPPPPGKPTPSPFPKKVVKPGKSTLPFEKVASSEVHHIGEAPEYQGAIHASRDELAAKLKNCTDKYEAMIPDSAFNGDTVDVNNPAYKDIKKQWEADMADIWGDFKGVNKKRLAEHDAVFGKEVKIFGEKGKKMELKNMFKETGSPPGTIRSDIDLTPKPGFEEAASLYAHEMAKRGHKVLDLPDRYVILDTDTTVWKASRFREKSGSQTYYFQKEFGARYHSDQFVTEGGLFFTSKGEIGIFDPEGAVLDNVKKFLDGYHSGNLDDVDWQLLCKSAQKISDIGNVKIDQDFLDRLSKVRNHATLEEADFVRFGDKTGAKAKAKSENMEKLYGIIEKGYANAKAYSAQNMEEFTKILNDPDLPASLKNRVREAMLDITLSKKGVTTAMGKTNGDLLHNLTGTPVKEVAMPDGTKYYYHKPSKKTFTKSEWLDFSMETFRKDIRTILKGPPKKDLKFLSLKSRPGFQVADFIVNLIGFHQSLERGQELALDAMQQGDDPDVTALKGTLHGLLYVTGLPDAWDVGAEKASEAEKQYLKILAEGGEANPYWEIGVKGTVKGWGKLAYEMTIGQLALGYDALFDEEGGLYGLHGEFKDAAKLTEDAEEYQDRVQDYVASKEEIKKLYKEIHELLEGKDPEDLSPEDFAKLQHEKRQAAWEEAAGKDKDLTYDAFLCGYNPLTGKYDPVLGALVGMLFPTRQTPDEEDEHDGEKATGFGKLLEYDVSRTFEIRDHRNVSYKCRLQAGFPEKAPGAFEWIHADAVKAMPPVYHPDPQQDFYCRAQGHARGRAYEREDVIRLLWPDRRVAPKLRLDATGVDGLPLTRGEFSLGWRFLRGQVNHYFSNRISDLRRDIACAHAKKAEIIEKGNRDLGRAVEKSKEELKQSMRSCEESIEKETKRLKYLELAAGNHMEVIDLDERAECWQERTTTMTYIDSAGKKKTETTTYRVNTCREEGAEPNLQVKMTPRKHPLPVKNCRSVTVKMKQLGKEVDALRDQLARTDDEKQEDALRKQISKKKGRIGELRGVYRGCKSLTKDVRDAERRLDNLDDAKVTMPLYHSEALEEHTQWIVDRRDKDVRKQDQVVQNAKQGIQKAMHAATCAHQDYEAENTESDPPERSENSGAEDTDYTVLTGNLEGFLREDGHTFLYKLAFFPAHSLWSTKVAKPVAYMIAGDKTIPVDAADDKLELTLSEVESGAAVKRWEVAVIDGNFGRFKETEGQKWAERVGSINAGVAQVIAEYGAARTPAAQKALAEIKRMYLPEGLVVDEDYFEGFGLRGAYMEAVAFTAEKIKENTLSALEEIEIKWEELFAKAKNRFYNQTADVKLAEDATEEPADLAQPTATQTPAGYNPLTDMLAQSQTTLTDEQKAKLQDLTNKFGGGVGATDGQGQTDATDGPKKLGGLYADKDKPGAATGGGGAHATTPTAVPMHAGIPGSAVKGTGTSGGGAAGGTGGAIPPATPGGGGGIGKPPTAQKPRGCSCETVRKLLQDWKKAYKYFNDYIHQNGVKNLPYWAPPQLSAANARKARQLVDLHLSKLLALNKCLAAPGTIEGLPRDLLTDLHSHLKENLEKLPRLKANINKMLAADPTDVSGLAKKNLAKYKVTREAYVNYWQVQLYNCQSLIQASEEMSQHLR